MNKRQFLKYSGAGLGGVALLWGLDRFGLPGTSKNPYLAGNYAPVEDLIVEDQLTVIGEIPKELSGIYLRNGPNPMHVVNDKKHHWFSGEGMLHGLRLDEGNALWYRNQSVDHANTHVISHGDKIYATVEAGGTPVEVSKDLTPTGDAAFEGTLNSAFSAHAKLDSDSGELHAMCYEFPSGNYQVNHVVVGQDGRVRKTQAIDLPSQTMLHECAITDNYILVFDLSVTFSLYKLTRGYFPFSWNDAHQARIGLLPRKGEVASVQWFNIDPCYLFHTFNAYEDDNGNVVVDAMRYQRLFDEDWNGPFTESPPMLARWNLNVVSGRSTESMIDELPGEFPRVHPALDGKAYRFGYCLGIGEMRDPDFGRIIKYDFVDDSREIYEFPDPEAGAEPVFIPSLNAQSEDEGYLMSLVYDRSDNKSNLQIFNAQSLMDGPIAKVMLPQRVPYGFHGNWINT